eukprot:957892-Karenia_brevis.AAC.1
MVAMRHQHSLMLKAIGMLEPSLPYCPNLLSPPADSPSLAFASVAAAAALTSDSSAALSGTAPNHPDPLKLLGPHDRLGPRDCPASGPPEALDAAAASAVAALPACPAVASAALSAPPKGLEGSLGHGLMLRIFASRWSPPT